MIRHIIHTILFLIPFSVFAQEDLEDIMLINKGIALFDLVYYDLNIDHEISLVDTNNIEGKIRIEYLKNQKTNILDSSLDYFEELIEQYPKSNSYFKAMYNAALICNILDYTDEAINYYTTIIESNANDLEEGAFGDGIMAEPYALYKNRSCKNLAEIYIKQNKFDSALKYVQLTKEYPYKHFCGNEYEANDIYIATLYTKIYLGLNKIDRALEFALPHIFYTGLADNTKLVELVFKILKDNFEIEKIRSDFEYAIANYDKEIDDQDENQWVKYYINFMNVKIEFPVLARMMSDEEEIKNELQNAYFLELLKRK